MQLTRRGLFGALAAAFAAPIARAPELPVELAADIADELPLEVAGDGVTDDTAALQQMIDRGEPIYGLNCLITAPLVLRSGTLIASSRLFSDHGGTAVIVPKDVDNCTIANNFFDFPREHATPAVLLKLEP